jgi:hypothetical protein
MAGVISSFSYIPYIASIIRKETIPARASWIIWSLLSFTILASYHSLGATSTIFLVIAYAVGTLITMVFSIFYGVGGWTKFDRLCLAVSISSLVVWWITDSAFLALVMNIIVDLTGTLPTIKKVYRLPDSENKLAWSCFFVGSFFNVLAINELSWHIALYPILLFVAIGIVFYLIFFRKQRSFSP